MLSYFQIIENKYSAAAQESVGKDCSASVSLDQSVDGTISQAATEGFAAWKRHDDAASDFCDLHGEYPPFVLLILFSTTNLLTLSLFLLVSYCLLEYSVNTRDSSVAHPHPDPSLLFNLNMSFPCKTLYFRFRPFQQN